MLDIAVTFLADELNSYLRKRGILTQSEDMAIPSHLLDAKGLWALDDGQIGITLINIEEERTLREQVPDRVYLNGSHVVLQPAIKLNLTLMFSVRADNTSSNKSGYKSSLNRLSQVLTFFQANPSFTADNFPGLSAGIEKLNIELLSYTPEQLNQTWAYMGSKYVPSVIYRVRMVMLQDAEPMEISTPITTVIAAFNSK